MTDFLLGFLILLNIYLWLRLKALQWEQASDSKYQTWWMTSMEERNADKPHIKAMDEALLNEDEPT